MEAILNSALPFFALIFCGYGAGRAGLMSAASLDGLNRFVFYFALPTLLFLKVSGAPLAEQFDWRFLVAYSGCSLTIYFVAALLGRLLFGHNLESEPVGPSRSRSQLV